MKFFADKLDQAQNTPMDQVYVALSQQSLLQYVKEARKNLILLHMLCDCKTEVIGHQQVTVLT